MALQIRIVVPSSLTGAVVSMARDHSGVSEISVLRGASMVPAGDVIVLQAVRESVETLLQKLHTFNIATVGSVSVTAPELVISDRLDAAEDGAAGDGADAIIWDEVEQDTSDDSKLTWSYLAFLAIAVQLAGIGIITDSTIAIVGAMVVGPEFGPLAGLALALVDRRWKLARRAATALCVGFPVAMVLTGVATVASIWLGLFNPADVLGNNRATEFIYHPGPYSFIVAVLAGAAGMLSLIGKKSAALVGVFISVTTVPAAGYVAVALVLGEPGRAGGSALQLLLNVAGIVISAAAVLLAYRLVRRRRPAPTRYSAEHAQMAIGGVGARSAFRR
ncbi:DUF389 domain-containing protein [Arthrobacter wenxiniae]|jgi:uncharacterized hydrophobic protein (TIGR00271 family)|uniref:DUF389 domain-containing protein n=1 Tax=Arthrobacter wenxiniae TaxID=2713570 RepID=A0A7Y7IJ84_9MICC|nr:DUF389 domain-containing protein [Arthrobacter wenxiniae]NVM96449.1 DUF389 domain-containing protein [Arthrobacter wenxiniae]